MKTFQSIHGIIKSYYLYSHFYLLNNGCLDHKIHGAIAGGKVAPFLGPEERAEVPVLSV